MKFSDCNSSGLEISSGKTRTFLAAFTRLSRRLLDRAFDARFKPRQNPKARFNGLFIEALAMVLKRLIPSKLKRAKVQCARLNPALKSAGLLTLRGSRLKTHKVSIYFKRAQLLFLNLLCSR